MLVPCPGCRRHVRATVESACPFCAAALPSDLASRAIPSTSARLSRGRRFAFATTVAGTLAVAGCSSDGSDTKTVDAGDDTNVTLDAAYGAPPPMDSGTADSGPADTGGNAALYGAVPADVGGD